MNSPASPQPWYYVDAQGQQQGPVSPAILVGHARQGRVRPDSLVWREGWPEWRPLSSAAAELGLTAAPASPPKPAPAPAAAAAPAAMANPATTSAPAGAPASPYAPSAARLDVEPQWSNTGEVVYAGFLRRWAAVFLDGFLIGIVAQVVAGVLGAVFAVGMMSALQDSNGAPTPAMIGLYLMVYLIYFVMAGLYYALMESSSNQATVGKMALGIKVTDREGRRLSFGHALARWFAAALSHLTLWIGFLMAGFTDRKRALHDFVANTLVVDKWAFTPHPERQQRGLGGCVIVFLVVVVGLGGLALLGILAAVAIPAYQDYTERARSRGAQLAPPALHLPAEPAASTPLPGKGRVWLAEPA